MAEAKGLVEAFLIERGCCVCLLGSTVLCKYGDARVGSLEERCGRDGCNKVVAVRFKPLMVASCNAMLVI